MLPITEQRKLEAAAYLEDAMRASLWPDGVAFDKPLRTIDRVGIIGAGTMGIGISTNFLSAGLPVTLVDAKPDALDRGVAAIRRNYESALAKGRVTSEQAEDALSLLRPVTEFDALSQCDFIIEAVYEEMPIKLGIFKRLDQVARPGAMLASNTSFLNIDQMAAVTTRPGDVLGTHFFSPAHIMKLVEIVRGRYTAPDALATAMQLMQRLRKVPVVCGVCYGFIGNRMLMQRQNAATAMLLEGASPEQIDTVHTDFGMPMGPFQMADLAGVDIGWHRDPKRIESVSDALCAAGRWGQKTKAGYYDYLEPRHPLPSPVTARIITEFRQRSGATVRTISEEEIVARTLYTMINEGARILEEGIAQRASDVDLVWANGFGWPAASGGPMFWAEGVGLPRIIDALERSRSHLPPRFEISPLLRICANAGTRIDIHSTPSGRRQSVAAAK